MTCDDPAEDWLLRGEYQCYFYPGRDCVGWRPGQACGRIGDSIPDDDTLRPERGPW